MLNLAAAAVVFLAIHLIPSSPLRVWASERFGMRVYMGVFALVSLSGFIWLVTAYGAVEAAAPFYIGGPLLRLFTAVAMLFAFVLLVVGATTPNPSAPGGEAALERKEPWRGVYAVTRHPVMWGIGLWALLHLLNRTDPAGLVFFGALALLSIGGAKLQELRKRAELGRAWQDFEAHTSFVPLAAILQGRAALGLADISLWRLAGGVVLWAIVLALHGALFGVTPLPF